MKGETQRRRTWEGKQGRSLSRPSAEKHQRENEQAKKKESYKKNQRDNSDELGVY